MKDIVIVGVCIVAFAFLVTVHVWIVAGLARRPPRWRALAGLLLPPLAPWFAHREHMRRRTTLWLVGAVVYLVALALMYTAR